MNVRHLSLGLVVALLVSIGEAGGQQTATTDKAKAAEEALKEKGVRRIGTYLALADETKLSTMLRDEPKLKRAMLDAQKEVQAVERQVEINKQMILTFTENRRQLVAKYDQSPDNRLVTEINELGEKIQYLIQNGDMPNERGKARGKFNQAREAYIEYLLAVRKEVNLIKTKYADLAADPKVKELCETLSKETGKDYKLVESRSFIASEKQLTKLEDAVLSDTIDMRRDGAKMFWVSAQINGKYSKEFTVDSGSSIVTVPWKMALELDIKPSATDPKIKLQLADGKTVVEATRITIPLMRVGKFLVENVEAAVMPENLPDAPPIIGMTFLQNFSFKIDSDTGKLTMNKVEAPAARSAGN